MKTLRISQNDWIFCVILADFHLRKTIVFHEIRQWDNFH